MTSDSFVLLVENIRSHIPHTLVQCEQVFGPFIAEVNKLERGLKPTETYVSKYSGVRTGCLMCVDDIFLV